MKENHFYIYGKNPILELLQIKPKNVKQIFYRDTMAKGDIAGILEIARKYKIGCQPAPEKQLKEYAGEGNNQGIVAMIKEFEYTELEDWADNLGEIGNASVLILDHIEDPHNFGALIRSALASGVSAVVIAKDNQAQVNATVFKTSAGAVARMPIIRVSNVVYAMEFFKRIDFWIAGVDMNAKENLWQADLSGKVAFVIGGEGNGLSRLASEKCDFLVSIPMQNDIESLNVSVAGALVMYEWKRRNSNNA